MTYPVLLRRPQQAFLSLLFCATLHPALSFAETYYIDAINGNDSHNNVQARDPLTPWQTLERAATDQQVLDGDTIIVKPGAYTQTLKPRDNNMTWRAEPRWGAILAPPATDEAVVKIDGKSGIILDGFVVHGGSTGIRYEDTNGGVIRNNVVYGAQFQGILLEDSSNIVVEGNRVFSNGVSAGGGAGIKGVQGTALTIRGNLVYANTDQGISLEGQGPTSLNNVIESNTVDSNGKDGIRLTSPVGQTRISNNIITRNSAGGSGIGLKIPNSPLAFEDYNNSWGNGSSPDRDFDLPSGTAPGPNDLSMDPLYIDPNGANDLLGSIGWEDDLYYLAQIATGQPINSPCVNTGDPTVVVDGTTATDNFFDEGVPDRGFHYATRTLSMEQFTFLWARTKFQKQGEQFFVSFWSRGKFILGPGNNGINPSIERIRIDLDTFTQTIPAGSCTEKNQGKIWTCKNPQPGISLLALDLRNQTFTLETENLPYLSFPSSSSVRLTLHIGDDVGSAERSYTDGVIRFP